MAILVRCRTCRKKKTIVEDRDYIDNPSCDECGGRLEVLDRGVPHRKAGSEASHLENVMQLLGEIRRELHKGKMKGEFDDMSYQFTLQILEDAIEDLSVE